MSTCTDCGKSPCVGRGLCKNCYYKRRRRNTLPPMIPGGYQERRIRGGCKIPGCPGVHEALGYCGKHYQRLTKIGSLDDPRATMADADRFWAQTKRATDGSGCLLWTSAIMKCGYPQVWWDGKTQSAHRIAYKLAVGEIPPRHQIDHKQDAGCRHTECVEPGHLEAVTHSENQQRKTFTPQQRERLAAAGRKGAWARWYATDNALLRFWLRGERARDGSGCLLWCGYVNKAGYANCRWEGRARPAHHVAWELDNCRPVPAGHDVDHVRERGCRHTHCIEPAHLEAVPMKVNRGRRAHPAVLRELPPERPGGPGRRGRNSAVQGGVTKLAPEIVTEMRELAAAGLSQAKIGKQFGVSQITVGRALRDAR